MKIEKTIVKNFKAISEKEIEFSGCSVIVTGANRRFNAVLFNVINSY